MKIMSGRTGEDTEAIRRRWPFPDPPLNDYNDLSMDGSYSIHKLDGLFENLTPDVNQEFNPVEYEQMK